MYGADVVGPDDQSDERKVLTLSFSGITAHQATLKNGTIVVLLRNLNPKKGPCNDTRSLVKGRRRNARPAQDLCESNTGDIVTIPGTDLICVSVSTHV